jgi:hypothetical protein
MRLGMEGLRNDYRGNRVFEYQLLLVIGFQDDGIFVEAFDSSGQFDSAHQIDSQESLIFARVV